jgi:hypothetical protein
MPSAPDRPALHYVLFALPTFTSRQVTDAISFTPQVRRVLYSVHPWPSWPKPHSGDLVGSLCLLILPSILKLAGPMVG